MAKELRKKYNFNKVEFVQSRILGKLTIVLKGPEEETGPKLKELYEKLMRE